MHRTPYPGGAPANVACALAKLGSKVIFIGNLGQDDLGDQMSDLLASGCHGILLQLELLRRACCAMFET